MISKFLTAVIDSIGNESVNANHSNKSKYGEDDILHKNEDKWYSRSKMV
jgi:hypothetical protein